MGPYTNPKNHWTLQKRGVWLCFSQGYFWISSSHQALEIPWFLGWRNFNSTFWKFPFHLCIFGFRFLVYFQLPFLLICPSFIPSISFSSCSSSIIDPFYMPNPSARGTTLRNRASDHSSSSIRYADPDPLDPTTAAHPPAAFPRHGTLEGWI